MQFWHSGSACCGLTFMSSQMKGKYIFLALTGHFGRGELPKCWNMLACRNNFLAWKGWVCECCRTSIHKFLKELLFDQCCLSVKMSRVAFISAYSYPASLKIREKRMVGLSW